LKTDDELEDLKSKVLAAIEEIKKDNQDGNSNREEPDKKHPVSKNSPKPDKINPDKVQKDKKSDLIAEIEKLKQEIQALKNNSNKTPEQQTELAKKENKLRELEGIMKKYDNTNQDIESGSKSNNNFPTG